MGLFSDIREQIVYRESGGDDLDSTKGWPPRPARDAEREQAGVLVTCPMCYKPVLHDELSQHVLQQHANEYVYLRINGRIMRAGSFTRIEKHLRSIEVVLHGIEEARVLVSLNGALLHEQRTCESLSLLPYLPDVVDGTLQVSVQVAGLTKAFTIYGGRQSQLNHTELDREISNLQHALDLGIEPAWQIFQERLRDPACANELERQYVRGFYAYTLAMWLDHKRQTAESRPHLEEAFTLLYPFDTDLARVALGVLAIRMNAFDYLHACRSFARLGLATAFFVDGDRDPHPGRNVIIAKDPDVALYIDTYLETYLEALVAYYTADAALLDRCLVALSADPMRSEPSNEAKYNLLQARVLLRAERREAREYYQLLLDDPNFGSEAEEYLRDR